MSRITGRQLRYENESIEEGREWRRGLGVAEWEEDMMIGSYLAVAAGELADTSDAVRSATADDGEAIARIYNHYVTDTTITFEEATVSAQDMARRITQTSEAGFPWLVAESDGAIVGYAYADKWKGRCSYRYSVETTVCLSPDHGNRSRAR